MPPVSKLRRLSASAAGRDRIRRALSDASGVVPAAARALGVPPSTLHEALRRYLTDIAATVEIARLPQGRPRKSAPDAEIQKNDRPKKKTS